MFTWIKDCILEIRIQVELHWLLTEKDRNKQREHAKRMGDLVMRRSPRRVEQMERKAGLR